jgi:tetratricopeptide (TPR) repeat protein
MPATVQAILAARIDRLPPDEKRLLETAAVIGKDVPFPLLQAIADEREDALRRELGQLRTSEFLYETTLFPDLEYTFKHALTHEVAYGSLLQERRRTLHARIVDAIERLHPGRRTEHIERLAHHALRGEQWAKAFAYLREAGTKAVTRSAYREAIAFWNALPHVPETPETLEHAIDIRFELRHTLVQVEGLPSLLPHLLEAERLAHALGDRRRLGWVYDYLSNYRYNVGDHREAVEAATRAIAIATDLGDFELDVAARFHLGCAHYYRGHYREAVELLRRDLQLVEQRPNAVLSLAELGEFSEGMRIDDEAARIAKETARGLDLTYAFWHTGDLYLRQGDLQRAALALEDGLARSRTEFPGLIHNLAGPLGRVYMLSGRVTEAMSLLTEALACATSRGVLGRNSRLMTYLAEGHLHAYRAAEARDAALDALRLAREHEERGDEAWALNVLGKIAAATDPPDVATAGARYVESMTLATELGMRPLVAHCHLGLGTLYGGG